MRGGGGGGGGGEGKFYPYLKMGGDFSHAEELGVGTNSFEVCVTWAFEVLAILKEGVPLLLKGVQKAVPYLEGSGVSQKVSDL